jgi:Uma2 family endonuclease
METAHIRSRLSFEAWCEQEDCSEVRHELINGELWAMVGGTDLHNLIALGLRDALKRRLPPGSCRIYVADVKLRVEDDGYYPDVMVSCSATDRERLYKTEPVLLAEVLSDTSVRRDRVDKLVGYRRLASLQTYLLLSQEAPRVEAWQRDEQGWLKSEFGVDDAVRLDGVVEDVPVREIYAEVLGEMGF